jgi:hypothetical protein
MTILIKTLATVAAGTVLATYTFAQSAKEVLGGTPYIAIENEPPPKVVVDPPLPDQLARGVVEIQYRVENLHIVPVFGAAVLNVSPGIELANGVHQVFTGCACTATVTFTVPDAAMPHEGSGHN